MDFFSFGEFETSLTAAADEDAAAAHAEPEAVADEVDAGFAARAPPAAEVSTGSALEDAGFCEPDCMLILREVELGEDIELPS